MFYRHWLIIAVLCTVASCSSTHKIAKDKAGVTVDLDTLQVTASRNNPYRASATKNFDLLHTKLEVSFNYDKQYMYGKATLTLKPHFYPQTTLVLDAKQFDILEISALKDNDLRIPLNFTYDSTELTIQLDKPYTADEKLNLFIYYTAKPNERKTTGSAAITEDKGLYFINPDGRDTTKPIQIWTQGETESNSCWFPTIDKPNQKATDEIYITHLKKYVSLSNGTLVYSKDNGDSTVTDYWKMNLPHAPYLVMMAIGDFAIIKDRWRDIPVNYYVEPKYAGVAKQIFGNTPEMIEFFSQKLGFDYPWPKYSQVVVRDYVSGAMENTSATLHGEFIQRNSRELIDETYEDVISHELFHQWFGDLVTTESWSNTPLNESFATYGEYLWNEYKYGREEADFKQYGNYNNYMQEAKEKNVDLIRYYYDNREDMFDRHSYDKGGMILHYLRYTVGDEAFFKSLELYLKANQFKPVEVHQLRLAFEEVTGRDMNWFFNEWFLNSGHPVLDIKYTYNADSVYVTISQKHNTDKYLLYTLPMQVDVYYGSNVQHNNIELKKNTETFAFKALGKPDLIDADATRVVLCEKTENKTTDDYIYQYLHAPLYVQQTEALHKIAEAQKENPAAKAILIKALNDKFFDIRQFAITELDIPKTDNDSILAMLQTLATTDKNSHVRMAAIEVLSKTSVASKYTSVFQQLTADSSYGVASAAIEALVDADSEKAMAVAKTFETDDNPEITASVASVYAKEGGAEYDNYFQHKLHTSTGVTKYYLFYYYANFLTRMDKNVATGGINFIENEGEAVAGQHFQLGAAKGALKRISKIFDEKKKKAKSERGKEDGQTAKLELEEKVSNYDFIISTANDALNKLNSATAPK